MQQMWRRALVAFRVLTHKQVPAPTDSILAAGTHKRRVNFYNNKNA
jgi:hypothetical protein